jgi:hypothetical protein
LAQDTQLELDTLPFLQAIPFVGHPNYAKWIDFTFHIPCKEKHINLKGNIHNSALMVLIPLKIFYMPLKIFLNPEV